MPEAKLASHMYVLIFIIGFLFYSFFSSWRDQRKLVIEREQQISDLTSKGKLALINIKFQNNPMSINVDKWSIQPVIVLKNIGSTLLHYDVKSIDVVIEGKRADNPQFTNRGALIYASLESNFIYPPILDVDSSHWPLTGSIEYEISYQAEGIGKIHTSKKSLRVIIFFSSGQYQIVSESET